MRYLDTSLIVAALTPEPTTRQAQHILADGSELSLVSMWTITEVSSALALKLRSGQIESFSRDEALNEFNRLTAENFEVMEVRRSHFADAARFCDRHLSGLRAGDALHLALAAGVGATVWTRDERMAAAGPIVGVPTRLV